GGQFKDAGGHHYIAKWNGTTWSAHSATTAYHGSVSGGISAMCLDTANNLIINYPVVSSNNYPLISNEQYVARFDGANWSEMGRQAGALSAQGDQSNLG